MYAASVKGTNLTFAVSGWLWRRSLVMVDQPSGSKWSHILGEAMEGPLRGTRLEIIPAVMTTWRAWKQKQPDTTVLAMSRTAREFDAEFQKRPRTFVLGVVNGRHAHAWPFDLLQRERVVNDAPSGRPTVVFYDTESTEALAFHRDVEEQTLTFEHSSNGRASDKETESLWDTYTGRCVSGPLKGKALRPTTAIISFRKAWNAFHPKSGIYEGK